MKKESSTINEVHSDLETFRMQSGRVEEEVRVLNAKIAEYETKFNQMLNESTTKELEFSKLRISYEKARNESETFKMYEQK